MHAYNLMCFGYLGETSASGMPLLHEGRGKENHNIYVYTENHLSLLTYLIHSTV